jgi:chromosome segregation ATPase
MHSARDFQNQIRTVEHELSNLRNRPPRSAQEMPAWMDEIERLERWLDSLRDNLGRAEADEPPGDPH